MLLYNSDMLHELLSYFTCMTYILCNALGTEPGWLIYVFQISNYVFHPAGPHQFNIPFMIIVFIIIIIIFNLNRPF